MALVDKINDDIKAAMLAKEKEKLESIRAIKSALLLAQTSGEAVTEEAELKILQRLVKQRKESADIYSSQNRQDLADKELFEVSIIEKYLPQQISEEELQKIISEIISQSGATSIKESNTTLLNKTVKISRYKLFFKNRISLSFSLFLNKIME